MVLLVTEPWSLDFLVDDRTAVESVCRSVHNMESLVKESDHGVDVKCPFAVRPVRALYVFPDLPVINQPDESADNPSSQSIQTTMRMDGITVLRTEYSL